MRSKFLNFYRCFFVLLSPPFGEVMLTTGGKVNLRPTGRRIVRRLYSYTSCALLKHLYEERDILVSGLVSLILDSFLKHCCRTKVKT